MIVSKVLEISADFLVISRFFFLKFKSAIDDSKNIHPTALKRSAVVSKFKMLVVLMDLDFEIHQLTFLRLLHCTLLLQGTLQQRTSRCLGFASTAVVPLLMFNMSITAFDIAKQL